MFISFDTNWSLFNVFFYSRENFSGHMTKCDIMAPHNRFIKLGKFLEIFHIAIVAVIDEQMPCVKRCVPIFQVAAKKIVLSIKYAYEIENENYRK